MNAIINAHSYADININSHANANAYTSADTNADINIDAINLIDIKYNNKFRKVLFEKINNMTKTEHEEIFKIIIDLIIRKNNRANRACTGTIRCPTNRG